MGDNGSVKLSRRHAWLLFAIAAWNVVTYAAFTRNLAADDGRPTGFYVAHSVLIVVNLVIAGFLAGLAAKVWKADRP